MRHLLLILVLALSLSARAEVSVSGSINVSNLPSTVSGGSPLPVSDSSANTSLSAISGKLPATLGQKTAANSLSVVINSDQDNEGIGVFNADSQWLVQIGTLGGLEYGNALFGSDVQPSLYTAIRDMPGKGTDGGLAPAGVIQVAGKEPGAGVTRPLRVDDDGYAQVDVRGGATSTLQTTANTSLSSIDGKLSTSATGSNQKKGKLTCSALTGSYATLVATTFTTCTLHVFNTCNNTILLSLDGGTTDYAELEYGESLALDLCANRRHVASGVNISAKHGGAAPTAGTLRASISG